MSARPIAQEYAPDRRGRRRPIHTERLIECRCTGCCQRRYWTPERKAARAAEISRQYAEGRRVWSPNANLARASHWQPEQDAMLRELVGQCDIATLAQRLTERFGVPRTESSVTHRIKRLGILILDHRPYTTGEVARMLGMSRTNLLATYVHTGELRGELRRGGQHGMLTYSRSEIERFIREGLPCQDFSRIRDSRLRMLAQAMNRGRRLLGTREVEQLTGVSHQAQCSLYRDGLVPSARRVRRDGAGRYGVWMIEAADVETVRRVSSEIAQERAQRRDSETGRYLGRAS